jgi:hypothetical protein
MININIPIDCFQQNPGDRAAPQREILSISNEDKSYEEAILCR